MLVRTKLCIRIFCNEAEKPKPLATKAIAAHLQSSNPSFMKLRKSVVSNLRQLSSFVQTSGESMSWCLSCISKPQFGHLPARTKDPGLSTSRAADNEKRRVSTQGGPSVGWATRNAWSTCKSSFFLRDRMILLLSSFFFLSYFSSFFLCPFAAGNWPR